VNPFLSLTIRDILKIIKHTHQHLWSGRGENSLFMLLVLIMDIVKVYEKKSAFVS
jgi:hypothetical protein